MTPAPPSVPRARLLRLLLWKRWIVTNTLIVAAAAVVISLLLPKWYLATASVFPPERQGSAASLLAATQAPGGQLALNLTASLLGGGSAFEMPLFASPSDIMAHILGSRILGERLIRKHDLMSHYKVDTMDDALDVLGRRLNVRVSREGFVRVEMLELDPQLAAELANDAIELMDEIQRERRQSAAQIARAFVERRLEETRRRLAAAEESLNAFQKRTGIVVPEEQAAALVDVLGRLTGRRMALEVQLEALKQIADPELPQVARLESDIRVLDEAIAKLGIGTDASAGDAGAAGVEDLPGRARPGAPGSLASFSDLMLEFTQRLREVKIQETLHEYLLTQFEFYRIQEVRDTPTVQLLEEARPPQKKHRPIRWLICVVSTLVGFVLTVGFFESLERLRDSAARGGTLSAFVEGVGGGFIVSRLRRLPPEPAGSASGPGHPPGG